MNIAKNLTELIGHTPLVELGGYSRRYGLPRPLVAKVEAFNPGGSVKARTALALIDDAERRGLLRPGILTMPETMSLERRNLLRALGAEIVLTPGAGGMAASIARAGELHRAIPGSFIPGQFDNPANPRVHELTTGPEIWQDTDGQVGVFVAGVGTGGTLTGVARCLKSLNPAVRIVAAEPASSPVLAGGQAGPHRIQGIGANFIPANYDASLVDEVLPVPDDEAIRAARLLATTDGLLCGISSGAALYAARAVALRPEMAGRLVVALLPDTGERYLSTELFAFDTYPLD